MWPNSYMYPYCRFGVPRSYNKRYGHMVSFDRYVKGQYMYIVDTWHTAFLKCFHTPVSVFLGVVGDMIWSYRRYDPEKVFPWITGRSKVKTKFTVIFFWLDTLPFMHPVWHSLVLCYSIGYMVLTKLWKDEGTEYKPLVPQRQPTPPREFLAGDWKLRGFQNVSLLRTTHFLLQIITISDKQKSLNVLWKLFSS